MIKIKMIIHNNFFLIKKVSSMSCIEQGEMGEATMGGNLNSH